MACFVLGDVSGHDKCCVEKPLLRRQTRYNTAKPMLTCPSVSNHACVLLSSTKTLGLFVAVDKADSFPKWAPWLSLTNVLSSTFIFASHTNKTKQNKLKKVSLLKTWFHVVTACDTKYINVYFVAIIHSQFPNLANSEGNWSVFLVILDQQLLFSIAIPDLLLSSVSGSQHTLLSQQTALRPTSRIYWSLFGHLFTSAAIFLPFSSHR